MGTSELAKMHQNTRKYNVVAYIIHIHENLDVVYVNLDILSSRANFRRQLLSRRHEGRRFHTLLLRQRLRLRSDTQYFKKGKVCDSKSAGFVAQQSIRAMGFASSATTRSCSVFAGPSATRTSR
jgi:hypothetical protein